MDNNNEYYDYVKHIFATGCKTEIYINELFLHEIMHFCGSGGSNALKEGINEFLTRKTALKYNFITSGCGYSKEVKIILELEKLFGEDIINQIAFINNDRKILEFLTNTLGTDAAQLYFEINNFLEQEFQNKYYSKINSYNGILGILRKVNNHSKLNYDHAFELIEQYKKDHVKQY